MSSLRQFGCCCSMAACILGSITARSQAGIVYDTPDSTYQQSFDSLPSSTPLLSVAWANDSSLPGWSAFATVTTLTQISAYSGSGVFVGGLHSLGTDANDRALGSTTTGTNSIYIAVAFTNATNISLDSLSVTYDGEQWRRGSNANADTLIFSYGFGDNFDNVASWTNVSALNFVSPIRFPGTATGLNGNLPANRVANINATLTGLEWVSGGTLWLRWFDSVIAGDDHTLAIDNFRFSASTTVVAIPEPSSMLLLGIAATGCLSWRMRKRYRPFSGGAS